MLKSFPEPELINTPVVGFTLATGESTGNNRLSAPSGRVIEIHIYMRLPCNRCKIHPFAIEWDTVTPHHPGHERKPASPQDTIIG